MKILPVTRPYNGMLAVKDYKMEEGSKYILLCEGKTQVISYPEDVLQNLGILSNRVWPSKFPGGKSYRMVYFSDRREK